MEAANRGDLDGSIPVHNQCENLDSSRIMRQNRPFKGQLFVTTRGTTDDAYAVASSYDTFTLTCMADRIMKSLFNNQDGRATNDEFIASLNKAYIVTVLRNQQISQLHLTPRVISRIK